MKKLFTLSLLFIAMAPKVLAQCQEPAPLPYMADFESVTVPSLPECMDSMWESFASNEIFESTTDAVAGFTGKLLVFDTTINTEFGMPANAWVSVHLSTPLMHLEQGIAYTLSFRYANSDPDLAISQLNIYLNGTGSSVQLDALEHITDATATDYVSMPFTPSSTGNYILHLQVASEGTQGQLYLDDITVQGTGVLGTDANTLSAISIYPNPAKEIVNVTNTSNIDSIKLYTGTGQLLLSEAPQGSMATLDLSAFSSGLYIAHIISGSQVRKAKIIKE